MITIKSFKIYHNNLIVKDLEALPKSNLLLLLEMSFSSKTTINKLRKTIGKKATHTNNLFYVNTMFKSYRHYKAVYS